MVKIIVTLTLISVTSYFVIQVCYCFYKNSSETDKVIFGTLIGALVGGFFTLMGSLAINKSTQKAVNAIRRKNVIYKPLYDELMEIHNEILKENPFPIFIVFKKGQRTMLRHPQYTVWGRIRMDSRLFEVPLKLKNTMEQLYKSLEIYQNRRKDTVVVLDQIYRDELKKCSNRQIANQANVGDSLLSNVLTGVRPDNNHLMWFSDVVDEKEADNLWMSLKESINFNVELKNCIEAKAAWNKIEEDALKLLGIYIQYITVKYEG